jgi:hypothetical protein
MNHPVQVAMDNGPERFQVVYAGRRSFKSERKKRKLIMGTPFHKGALTSEKQNYFYAAPTREQAKRIAWKDLCDMTQPFWAKPPSQTELIITLITGSTIHVLGMDKPERIEGNMWHGGVLDEYGNMKEDAWPEHIQPVTSDTKAWVDFIGVPEGRNHYYNLAEMARRGDDPDWQAYTWKSADILDPEEIAKARRVLDERTFRQEYEASFENFGGLAYYAFSEGNYTNEIFIPNKPVTLCWDFNVGAKPMSCILVQGNDKELNAVKEFVFRNSNTEETCRAILDYFNEWKFNATLRVTGDFAGKRHESLASFTDYEIISHYFKNFKEFTINTRPTLSVRDRVAALNALFNNSANEKRMFVNPTECPKLLDDLYKVEWKESGQGLDDRHDERTHATDALSYFAYNYYPMEEKITTRLR